MEKVMKFPVLQIQSAQGPFFYQEEHTRGLPSTGNAVPLGAQTFAVKDERGNTIGQVVIPPGFTIVRQ